MVPAAGVEPATFRSGGERSNPLSYAGMSGQQKITQLPAESGTTRARLQKLPLVVYHKT